MSVPADVRTAEIRAIDAPTILCTGRSEQLDFEVEVRVGIPLTNPHDCIVELYDAPLLQEPVYIDCLHQGFTTDSILAFSFSNLGSDSRYALRVGLSNFVGVSCTYQQYFTSEFVFVSVNPGACDSLEKYVVVQYDCLQGLDCRGNQTDFRVYSRFLPAYTTIEILPDSIAIPYQYFTSSLSLQNFIFANWYNDNPAFEAQLYVASLSDWVDRDSGSIATSFGDFTTLQLGTPGSFTAVWYGYMLNVFTSSPYNYVDPELKALSDITIVHELGHTRAALQHVQLAPDQHVLSDSCVMNEFVPIDPTTNRPYLNNRTLFCDSCIARLQQISW